MSFPTDGSSKIREAMAAHTSNPEYDNLPESVKLMHTPEGYAWLGDEKSRVIERETMPDYEVIE